MNLKKTSVLTALAAALFTAVLTFTACPQPVSTNDDNMNNGGKSAQIQISFDTDGGSTVEPIYVNSEDTVYFSYGLETFDAIINSSHSEYPVPEKEGFVFDGWYTDTEYSTIIDESNKQTVTQNICCHAKWTPVVTISFDTCGGTSFEPIKIRANKTLYFNYNTVFLFVFIDNESEEYYLPVKEGCIFQGWYTDSSYTTIVNSSSKQKVSENTTYYAKWSSGGATISFDTMGGNSINPVTAIPGSTVYFDNITHDSHKIIMNSLKYDLPSPVKDGCSFEGWYTDSSYTTKIDSNSKQTVTENITWYARWVSEVTINFETDGGSKINPVKTGNETTVYFKYLTSGTQISINETFIDINDPVKKGFVFDGWYTDSTYTVLINSSNEQTLTENVTWYAKWLPEVTISFNTGSECSFDSINAGTGNTVYFSFSNSADENYHHIHIKNEDLDRTQYIKLNNPTKEGFLFDGWYTDDTYTTKVDIYNPQTMTENITLYAKWKDAVIISFDTCGGNSVDPVTVNINDVIYTSLDYTKTYFYINNRSINFDHPVKTGYTFKGWYTDTTYSTEVNSSNKQTITENVTYYAKWSPSVTISLDPCGGESIEPVIVGSGDTVTVTINSYYYSSTIKTNSFSKTIVPEREGYYFLAWYTDTTYTTKIDTQTVTENVTWYAKWTPEVTVTFDTCGGSPVDPITTGSGFSIYIKMYTSSFDICINNIYNKYKAAPTKPGYVFKGWYTDTDYTTEIDSDHPQTLTGDVTYYARWILNVMVTFKSCGGSYVDPIATESGYSIYFNSSTSGYEIYINGSSYKSLDAPARTGYIFDGWYTDTDYTTEIDSDHPQTLTGDVTYYAKWIPGVTVSFDTSGGSSVDPITISTGYSIYFNNTTSGYYIYINGSSYKYLKAPTMDNCTFDGWYTDITFFTKVDSDHPQTLTGDVTYYAKWTVNQ